MLSDVDSHHEDAGYETDEHLLFNVLLSAQDGSTSWAANKRFEISKLKFKFPRARTHELIRARSRLYRSQILQVNTLWKALDEIYTMHSFAQFSKYKHFR